MPSNQFKEASCKFHQHIRPPQKNGENNKDLVNQMSRGGNKWCHVMD